MGRLILDTNICIEGERSGVLPSIKTGDDVAIAAITAAELLRGVEMSTGRHKTARLRYVEDLLEEIPVEDYDLAVARAHAELLALTERRGRQRQAFDLIIASTARATDRLVVTTDERAFADLPGVEVRLVR